MVEQLTQEIGEWVRVLSPVSIYLMFLITYFENIIPSHPWRYSGGFWRISCRRKRNIICLGMGDDNGCFGLGFHECILAGKPLERTDGKAWYSILDGSLYRGGIYRTGPKVDGSVGSVRASRKSFSGRYAIGYFSLAAGRAEPTLHLRF